MHRNTPTKVEIYLRVLCRDLLRVAMLLLISLAGRYYKVMKVKGMGQLKSRECFIERNVELQKELGRFYASYYYLCPSCEGCCHSLQTPYLTLDMVLYGISDRPIAECDLIFQIKILFCHYFEVLQRWVQSGKQDVCQPQIFNEDRVTECLGVNGCIIPLGQRPTYCIFFPCGGFLKYMDWSEYWRCMRLSLKYLRHLTVSLMAIMAEYRQ